MPAQHGVRLDDRESAPQRWKQPAQPNEEQAIGCRQPKPRGSLSPKHVQLMTQNCDLGFQPHLRPEGRCQGRTYCSVPLSSRPHQAGVADNLGGKDRRQFALLTGHGNFPRLCFRIVGVAGGVGNQSRSAFGQ
jgi:hypothetical protein